MMKRRAKGKIKEINPATHVFESLRRNNMRRAISSAAARAVEKTSKDYLYFVTSGIHGDQRDIDPQSPTFGQFKGNDNGDFFCWNETLLRKAARGLVTFETWIGCPVHLNHDEGITIGDVIGSYPFPNQEEKSIDFLNRVHRSNAARHNARLISDIENGVITDTSMGCIVAFSFCGICGNHAETENEWCNHLRYNKGRRLGGQRGPWVYEDNRGIIGLEDSIITVGAGADPQAKIDFSIFKSLNHG